MNQPRNFNKGDKVVDIFDKSKPPKTVSRSYWQNYAGGDTSDYTVEFDEGGWNKSSSLMLLSEYEAEQDAEFEKENEEAVEDRDRRAGLYGPEYPGENF